MANRGRSSDHPYPTGQYPPSRDQPAGPQGPAESRPPWAEQAMPLAPITL